MSPEKLGQHFLTDASWQERIARAVRIDGGVWVEIGAGHGEMTTRLAQRASKVFAIELDRATCQRACAKSPRHQERGSRRKRCNGSGFREIDTGERFSVYGNLPYYITSPILHRLFEHADQIAAIHIVIQFEVAARIVAPPKRRDYGYLSVVSQWFSRPGNRVPDSAGSFRPPPKVASALVSFRMPGARDKHPVEDESAFLDFVKECFTQKRKTLRNNLRARLGSRTEEVLREAGLSPGMPAPRNLRWRSLRHSFDWLNDTGFQKAKRCVHPDELRSKWRSRSG